MNQLDLFEGPESAEIRTNRLGAWAAILRSPEEHRAGIMAALRRDLETLAGPPEYVAERSFYEERIAGYRDMLRGTIGAGG